MRRFLLLIFVLLSGTSYGQRQLADSARISILTLGPYQGELYSAFGHSAIRVYDPASHMDMAFNYGVFDFDMQMNINLLATVGDKLKLNISNNTKANLLRKRVLFKVGS